MSISRPIVKTSGGFYTDVGRLAWQSIFAHKLRAFLTLIGLIIGVSSVVVVGAAINGLNGFVSEKVTTVLGANHFMIVRLAARNTLSEEEWERQNREHKRLDIEDYDWVRERCTSCLEVGAWLETRVNLHHKGRELFGTEVAGVTANIAAIEDKKMAEGRFILSQDVETTSNVCVLGWDVAQKLFPYLNPIGEKLRVDGIHMKIVGVEEKRGSLFGHSFDNIVYLPLTTYRKTFGAGDSLQIHGNASSPEELPAVIEEASTALRLKHQLKLHERDDFSVIDTTNMRGEVDRFTGGIALVVTPVTLISLIVGGIVVMNIMLVSVTERTFEIGLRRAVGASRKHIILQFLVESALLCLLGGIIGIALAFGLAWSITVLAMIPMRITLAYIILSLLFSVCIGLLAGIYPAYKAARLNPIIALTQN